MIIERPVPARDEVVMDDCHIALIGSLAMCSKPRSLLELGIGSGATTHALLEAMRHNGNGASLTCVDNFFDWGGSPPPEALQLPVKLVVHGEREFIASCKERFDFIVSDADHDHSHEWAVVTLALLNEGGIAVFHDILNDSYKNLLNILEYVQLLHYPHRVFNKSSREDERCQRGLLVLFKPKPA